MKKFFLLFLKIIIVLNCFAQNKVIIDSLQIVLKNTGFDTAKANVLNELSKAYLNNDPDKSMYYANQSLKLSESIDYKKGFANANSNLGNVDWIKGSYLTALEYHKKAIAILDKIGDKTDLAYTYSNLGNVFTSQGNYPEALKNYYSALKTAEEIGDKFNTATGYVNIGLVYNYQKNYVEALKNYLSGLKLMQEIGDKYLLAKCYINIGFLYDSQKKYPEALKYYFEYLKISEEIGSKQDVGGAYLQIGPIFTEQGKYSEALKMGFLAAKIFEEIEDKESLSFSYFNIGDVYTKQKKYTDAYFYYYKGLEDSKKIGSLGNVNKAYLSLAKLDSIRGNFKDALENYKLFIVARDSMFNQEKAKELVRHQMQYDFDKKESFVKAEQEKKDAVAQKEMQKQKLVRNGFIGGFAVVLLFAGVFFTQRNRIKKGKQRSDELLLNILPEEVAEELKAKGSADAKQFDDVTVMFTDFKNFTQISEKLSPTELVNEIHTCFKAFDNIIGKHNIEKIKTIGDAYMCAGGLPVTNKTNAIDVVSAAMEIQTFMQQHSAQRYSEGKEVFEIRIGVHTGSVVAGIVGVKKFAYDIWGDTVNIASRMESSGEAGKVNISGSTYVLVKEKFKCKYRGEIETKGKGMMQMYFVEAD